MYSIVNNNITNFEACEFTKNTKLLISRERNIVIPSNEKNHSSKIKYHNKAKYNLLREVSFKGTTN